MQSQSSSLCKGCSSAHLRVQRALARRWLARVHVCYRPCSQMLKSSANDELSTPSPAAKDQAISTQLTQIGSNRGSAGGAPIPTAPPNDAQAPVPLADTEVSAVSFQAEYDSFAKAWKPPPGEPPLWFVEKYEARRLAEARRKAQDPSFITTQERVTAPDTGGRQGNPAVRFIKAILQVVQLVLVLGLLLLLPAAVHDGGLSLTKPFTTFAAYLCFFGFGSVLRIVRYGSLTARKQDRQVASWSGRLMFAVFVTVIPLLHWCTMYRFVGLTLYTDAIPSSTTLYDVIGVWGMFLAVVLNGAAARELGASYDRVAAPTTLVTSGPYRYIQHPIYTSYMLLFFSYGMWLHSGPAAVAMLVVCALYYRFRTLLESRILEEAFGGYYRDYAARTKKFLPLVV